MSYPVITVTSKVVQKVVGEAGVTAQPPRYRQVEKDTTATTALYWLILQTEAITMQHNWLILSTTR